MKIDIQIDNHSTVEKTANGKNVHLLYPLANPLANLPADPLADPLADLPANPILANLPAVSPLANPILADLPADPLAVSPLANPPLRNPLGIPIGILIPNDPPTIAAAVVVVVVVVAVVDNHPPIPTKSHVKIFSQIIISGCRTLFPNDKTPLKMFCPVFFFCFFLFNDYDTILGTQILVFFTFISCKLSRNT